MGYNPSIGSTTWYEALQHYLVERPADGLGTLLKGSALWNTICALLTQGQATLPGGQTPGTSEDEIPDEPLIDDLREEPTGPVEQCCRSSGTMLVSGMSTCRQRALTSLARDSSGT